MSGAYQMKKMVLAVWLLLSGWSLSALATGFYERVVVDVSGMEPGEFRYAETQWGIGAFYVYRKLPSERPRGSDVRIQIDAIKDGITFSRFIENARFLMTGAVQPEHPEFLVFSSASPLGCVLRPLDYHSSPVKHIGEKAADGVFVDVCQGSRYDRRGVVVESAQLPPTRHPAVAAADVFMLPFTVQGGTLHVGLAPGQTLHPFDIVSFRKARYQQHRFSLEQRFVTAIGLDDLAMARRLYRQGANVNGRAYGQPLNIAIINQSLPMVDFLLTAGAVVDRSVVDVAHEFGGELVLARVKAQIDKR